MEYKAYGSVQMEISESTTFIGEVDIDLPCPLGICLRLLGLLPVPNGRGYGYGVLATLLLTSIVCCHIVDVYDIINDYLGMQHDTIFLLSYLTYLPHLAVTLVLCIVARMYLSCAYDPGRHRIAVFSAEYLKERSAYSPRSWLWWRLLGFMTVPSTCITFKLVVFACKYGTTNCPRDGYVYFRTLGGVTGYAFYGCFCFVISCLRRSHEEEFYRVAIDISRRSAADIETTKADVRRLWQGFRGYCDFVGRWMMLSMSLAILGLVDLFWFVMYTIPEIRRSAQTEENVLLMWTVFIFADKLLFILQPLLALGGTDAGRPWRFFMESVVLEWDRERRQATIEPRHNPQAVIAAKESKTLEEVISHIRLLGTGGSWLRTTLIFTIMSLYFGLTFDPTQNLDPWVGFACRNSSYNDTINLSVPSVQFLVHKIL